MSRYWPIVTADVAGSMTYSQLKTTSSAVKGLPSCHTTFFFRRQVTDNPSFATCPFWRLGTSAASTGTMFPSGSYAPSGSEKTRAAAWPFGPLAKGGFKGVGACHPDVLTLPPPPRFLGFNG